MKDDFALLQSFDTHTEAALLQSYLDHNGISSELVNAHITSVNHLYSNLAGGVKLYVHKDNFEAAKKLMTTPNEALNHSTEYDADLPEELRDAPEETNSPIRLKQRVLTFIYFGVPLILLLIYYYTTSKK